MWKVFLFLASLLWIGHSHAGDSPEKEAQGVELLVTPEGVTKVGKNGFLATWLGAEVEFPNRENETDASSLANWLLNGKQQEFGIGINPRAKEDKLFKMPVGKMSRGEALAYLCKHGDYVVAFKRNRPSMLMVCPKEQLVERRSGDNASK